MMWALFSILAAFVWASVNMIDKYYMSKWIKNPMNPMIILAVVGLISSFFIYSFQGFSALSYFNIGLCLLAGVFYFLSIIFYFKAVQIEEISRVIPLYYLSVISTAILAAIFLDEIFTSIKYLGIFLLVFGAVLLSTKSLLKFKLSKGFWLMVLASLIMSLSTIITKYLLEFTDFWTVFSYVRIGAIFPLIPVLYLSYRDLILTVKKHGVKVIGLMTLAESLNIVAVLLFTVAMSVGFVTLANALSSVQPFFVFLFALLISLFYPKILKEEIGKRTLLLKLLAIVMIFGGVLLIT